MPHSKNNVFTEGVAYKMAVLILERPDDKLRLNDMAVISGYSVNYIKYMFKDHIGTSIGRFIKDVYLHYAAKELNETNTKIIAIALNAGYCSQQSFSRAFRNKFHLSPTEFRELTTYEAALLLKVHDVNPLQLIAKSASS